jgi:hypothetical protein
MKESRRLAIIDKHRWRNVTAFLNPPALEGLRAGLEIAYTSDATRRKFGTLSAYQRDVGVMGTNKARGAAAGTDWGFNRYKYLWGIRALQAAVLEQAIRDLHPTNDTRTMKIRIKAEAKEWFLDDTNFQPFSFVAICDSLDVSPDLIRRNLHKYAAYKAQVR